MPKIVRLPGLVDVHVHLREPGNTQKEDFSTGTKAAIAGGYTTVLDMPNNPNSIVTPETLKEKIKLARRKIYSDVGFHFGGSRVAVPYFEQIKTQVFGLKVYMNHTTGNLLMESDEELDEIFSKWPRTKILMVHAEGPTLSKAIGLAKKYKNRLHVCHVSLASEINQIKKAKENGIKITCEVSAHHLFLTEEDLKRVGTFGIMKPPLSTKKDVEYIWKNFDAIDMIASDHAPHTVEEKLNTKQTPFGVPGLETTLPLLLNAVNEGRLSLDRVIEMTSITPKRIFGLNNRHSEPEVKNLKTKFQDPSGPLDHQDDMDTFVEVDMNEEWTIRNANIISKSGWTPFDGMKIKGKVKKVVLRGKIAFDGKEFFGPFGKIIYPA